ncbi:MAG: glucose 1-dehydrogenase [Chloroflexi bacterium]|nr:glucose 1-dehydrogenase [Chloroflexota bacterium]MCI0773957.1 glucose 1-dehydrogenase [Chloroflexota bacterium]MCI0807347.1 glucose 1-dehydrogenase [Chloroflexota bacterium]MCI0827887.1 glucose 1-dehydrogenase [Chloroflexota bacterium]MCI0860393.1 glucose 1-dehydrogenase [Chloroflexota bacterium]
MTVPSPDRLLDFSGKVVLVTGGGRGIGAGLALRFAEAGADVALSFFSSEAGANQVVQSIQALDRNAVAVQADVRSRADVERLVEKTVEELGALDVLINNAGIYPLASVLEMTDEQWDDVLDTNLRSVYLGTQVAASQMIRQGSGGAIVNIASIEAENPASLHSHYHASKAGVVMHTKAAARELGKHDIRVNVVSPGLIWAEDLEVNWPDGVSRYLTAAPLRRLGLPDDVGDACLFLASAAARWITGANLVVDGGVLTSTAY